MDVGDFSIYTQTAELLKVLSHPVRLCIVRNLIEKGECNVSHMQNCLQSPQSTVSQHLQKLRAAGVICGIRRGLEIYYKVHDPKAMAIVVALFESGPQK